MIAHPRLLIEVFAMIPDFRQAAWQTPSFSSHLPLWRAVRSCVARAVIALLLSADAITACESHSNCVSPTHTPVPPRSIPSFATWIGTSSNATPGRGPRPSLYSAPRPGDALARQSPCDGKHSEVPKNKGRQGYTCYRHWRTMWASPSPNTLWTIKPMRSRPLSLSYSN